MGLAMQTSDSGFAARPAISLRDLTVAFSVRDKVVRAVSGVNLEVQRGQTVALIGESGSGKSVTMRSILRLNPARTTRITGEIFVGGRDVLRMTPAELSAYRGKVAAMVFQEPLLALDPVYSVGTQIVEAIQRHETVTTTQAERRALELFQRVRIPGAERRLKAYPHEMSGGMRQRAMIALALACKPQVLLADEPTTALDATVQIQILLLLRELQRDLRLSGIFVTHDIGAAIEVADRIAVMYAGRIVEEGTTRDLIRSPRHPYTIALLKSRAHGAMTSGGRLQTIGGTPPDLSLQFSGCAFRERCARASGGCARVQPPVAELEPGHLVSCFHIEEAVNPSPEARHQPANVV